MRNPAHGWVWMLDDDETLLLAVPGGVLVRIFESTNVDAKATTAMTFVPGVEIEVAEDPHRPGSIRGRMIWSARRAGFQR